MKVGYLHCAQPTHGLVRYGKQIAQHVGSHAGVDVVEVATRFDGRLPSLLTNAVRSAVALRHVDVVHNQHNDAA